MTRVIFASFLGVSTKIVKDWETGRKKPDGPACRIFAMLKLDSNLLQRMNIIVK